MPVPQESNFIVERASCSFLTMVQYLRFKRHGAVHPPSAQYQTNV
ncbi:hypothetical protein QUA56_31365 [Microcoleus sp. N3A4]